MKKRVSFSLIKKNSVVKPIKDYLGHLKMKYKTPFKLRFREHVKRFKGPLFTQFKSFNLEKSIKTKPFKYVISIKTSTNNMFCTVSDLKLKKTILHLSCGKLQLKSSKKLMKFASGETIKKFIKQFNLLVPKGSSCLLYFEVMKKSLSYFFRKLRGTMKTRRFLIHIKRKKCFNGSCAGAKKRRRKRFRRTLRIWRFE